MSAIRNRLTNVCQILNGVVRNTNGMYGSDPHTLACIKESVAHIEQAEKEIVRLEELLARHEEG